MPEAMMKYLARYLDWCAALLLPDEPDEWTVARARVVMAACYVLMIIVLIGCALVLASCSYPLRFDQHRQDLQWKQEQCLAKGGNPKECKQ